MRGVGCDCIKLHTNLAPACMKKLHVAWPSTTSPDQQCSHGCLIVPWSLLCAFCKS